MARQGRGITRRRLLTGATLAAASTSLVGRVPSAFAQAAAGAPRLGGKLMGTLEGPEIVLDAARWPKRFAEAPVLAQLGERLPQEPLVVKPVHAIGRYGGTWRRAFTGPGDSENGNRISSTDKILFWDYTGTKVMPCVARAWKISDDGRTTTITLRKGMKWSDGHPFSADDFVFWYEDIYSNKELQPTPNPEFMINGKPGRIRKIDDVTVAFEFPDPNFLFVDILAGPTAMGGGQWQQSYDGRSMGAYRPAHYLKQFHAKYVPRDELDRKVKAAGFDSWVTYIKNRWHCGINPDLPVLSPWKTVTPINSPVWGLERNPYYMGVDSEGNQLPYFDRVTLTLAENLEVLNLRAAAGQYDVQERHVAMTKIPVFVENRQKGNYDLRIDPALNGSDATMQTNQAYEADPEVARWLKTADFRRALSLAIDREQINEAFFIGLGDPGSVVPGPDSPYSPGAEWRKKWAVLDVQQANSLLDKVGLSKKDGEGYRLRTDGKGRLRLEILTAAAQFIPHAAMAEMIRDQWRKIGIELDIKEVERTLFFTRIKSNEHQMAMWTNDGSEIIYLFPRHALPVDPAECLNGHPIAAWYASGGAQGKKPEDPELVKALEMFRSANGKKTAQERIDLAKEIWKILADQVYGIGTVGVAPAWMGVRIASKRVGNVPARQMNAQHCRTPGTSHPATFYFKS